VGGRMAVGRIVTTTYRYKRPPRKRKRIVLTGSAIVTSKRKADAHTPASDPQAIGSAIVRRVNVGNANRSIAGHLDHREPVRHGGRAGLRRRSLVRGDRGACQKAASSSCQPTAASCQPTAAATGWPWMSSV
jgi:hypothetical protein